MNNETDEKKNIVKVFLTGFIRLRGVVNWSALSFMGFILGMSSLDLSSYVLPFSVFVVTIFCILSFTFGINNYYDIDSDRKNPRRKNINAMASGKIPKQTGLIINLIFFIIPLVISILFKLEVFLLCVVFLFWMWAYSAPPLRLKGRPVVDIIWHFFAFVLLIIWGSFIAGSVGIINWLVAISLGIFSCIDQVDNHISDYSFDKNTGTTTYAVWVGLDTAKTTLKMIIILHTIFLIPLILLYSLSYISTILIISGGAVIGIILAKSKKDSSVSSLYYFSAVFGVAVYLSCIVYHINILLG
jgi:4-hydroxybenzoate polyprenyltransferase